MLLLKKHMEQKQVSGKNIGGGIIWNSGLASTWVWDFNETKNDTMVVYFVVASPKHL